METIKKFKETIKRFLDERAKTDELFAVTYAKKNKSLDECCSYIMGEALKASTNIGSGVKGCGIDDDNVFSMAIHYYDEDDLKINKVSGSSKILAPAKIELSEDDKKAAHEAAIRRLTEEQYESLRKKPNKKKEVEVQQMSLF